MPTAPQQTLNTTQKILMRVVVLQDDGVTPDTTSALSFSQPSPPNATFTVDPVDNRLVTITAQSIGTTFNGKVGAAGVPGAAFLTVPIEVTAPPDLSAVNFVSADPPVPQ